MNREDIMADNNAASDKEKVVTKYDRKMQKRKEEERKDKLLEEKNIRLQ